ncbi:CKLF-like MARVEL transmembrane domain-containing protein 1 isoform X2 [Trachypithecus francoisi]|uniref:CKLF-like MARVEL transmembrane domain-containing protein 1 isoform X2 n=1 Tax=Trachypithecus francoisi TaxID=54180 RepID=UPI00141B34C1|nr:CKLF-like MARVEL transmembrane domain-containing protein 1 isoform X2 [Trachypithecus francoisi]
MDPGDAKPESPEAPSGNLKQPETATALPSSGSVVSSVPKAQRNVSAKTASRKHPAVSIRTAKSAATARPQGSEGTAPSKKATTRPPPEPTLPPPTPTLPPPTPSAHTESKLLNETAIKERAEGRAKVPYKFRDSLKRFSFSPTGILKILRMSLIIGALACFIIAQANESFITITILEIFIVLFFILIYMLTLHHLLTYLHWPLLDLTNSIITAVFLSVVAILAMQEKKRRHLFYVGGSLCLTAVIVCCIDAFVVTKMMRTNLKRFLGIEFESKLSPAKDAYPETGPDAPQRPA